MKYMLMLFDNEDWWNTITEEGIAEDMKKHEAFAAWCAEQGITITGGAALQASATATTLRRGNDEVLVVNPSPVVAVSRAVAIGMATTPEAGLEALDAIIFDPHLRDYAMVPAARADLFRRCGRFAEAADAYREAAHLSGNGVVQAFLNRRIVEMRHAPG